MNNEAIIWPVERASGSWHEWSAYTYPEFIEKVYEPLRARHPEYITRESIGFDETGKIEMFAYTFTPENFTETVYLQSGVHAREEDAWTTLARMMTMITEEYEGDEYLTELREHCRFYVVPVVNVWGITEIPLGLRKDPNVNGVNLNRDILERSQGETRAVCGFIERAVKKGKIDFALDYHTTVNSSYGDYMLTVWTGSANEHVAKNVLMTLAEKNKNERTEEYYEKREVKRGELRLPFVGDSKNPGTYVWWWREIGIPGATVEYSDFVFDTERNTDRTNRFCLENMLSQLISHFYALRKDAEK